MNQTNTGEEWIDCDECDGTGVHKILGEDCPQCKGEGGWHEQSIADMEEEAQNG